MEFITRGFKWLVDGDGGWLSVNHKERAIKDFIDNLEDKPYKVTIKPHRQKRSLDANSYAWTLINEIANVLRISKDECYLMMLKRYGQSELIKLLTKGLPILLKAVKYYEVIKEDGECTYVKVFAGSSEYDSREMAILIDGIISEAKELGIETMTREELERMKGAPNEI